MDWPRTVFNLPPVFTVLLILGACGSALFFIAPKSDNTIEKAAPKSGLKQMSMLQFAQYLNRMSCACLQAMFDASKFNSPSIGEIYSGKYEKYIVTIFTLVLPTSRRGTWQTVIHLRHDPPAWLPMFSIIDEVVGKNMSRLLQCEHTRSNALINPNFINRHDEADKLRVCLSRKPVDEFSISAMKSPLHGIVLDSTGEDLFFYRHGEIVEPNDIKKFIERSIKLWQMIDTGNIDISLFKNV